MSEPPLEEESTSLVSGTADERPGPKTGAKHDPEGVDLATRLAHQYQQLLPPPNTTPPRRRARKTVTEQRSGAHADERDPQLVGQALHRLAADRGWQTALSLQQLLTRWADLVGETNAQHCSPESYRDQVLVVRAESTTWATSLRLIAPQLVARLNEQLGQGTVLRIDIKGPTAPSWKHGPRVVRDGRGPRDTYG